MSQFRGTVSAESQKLPEPLRTIATRLFLIADSGFFLFHVCAWKIDYLAETLIHAIDANNPIALANNTRALVEHIAALIAVSDELEALANRLPGKNSEIAIGTLLSKAEVFLRRAYYGKSPKSTIQKEDQALHINDCLDSLAKQVPDIKEVYDFLCEYVHPNYGSNALVSSGQLAAGHLVPSEVFNRPVLDRLKHYCVLSMKLLQDREISQFGILIRLQGLVELCFVTRATVRNVFTVNPASPDGDGMTRETAFVFRGARTHQEGLALCHQFLKKKQYEVRLQQFGGLVDGYAYDEFSTDRGTIWFKTRIDRK